MGSSTPRSQTPLTILTVRLVLPSHQMTDSALRTNRFSALYSPARRHRYRRFTGGLATDGARLAETCDWFRLHIGGLSPPTFCQFA
ncbi:MAG: hypothetical protein OXI52_07255 [Caldilineaceae bacterium]|nr:hypothetical protein [Caldilineaceae bacterium]